MVLYAFGQGNTLNGYKGQKWTLETLTDNICKQAARTFFDSGIKNYTELADIISRIKGITDEGIDRTVDSSISTIMEFKSIFDKTLIPTFSC
ncbi:MAG: hypothetical protein ABSB40_01915 [Nitrososphaeria archaeon]